MRHAKPLQRLILLVVVCVCSSIFPACGGGGGGTAPGGRGSASDDGFDAVAFRLLTTEIEFEPLFIGDEDTLPIRVLNLSDTDTLEIARCDLPSEDFLFPDDPFPLPVGPGEVAELNLRCAPAREGNLDGELRLWPAASDKPLRIPVRSFGRLLGGEEITDFGNQTLVAGGRTPLLSVNLPPDAVSLSIEAVAGTTDVILLDSLTGPGPMVYENPQSTGPYQWGSKVYAFGASPPPHALLTTVPNSDRPGVQLVPGGGTYTFRFRRAGTGSPMMRVRAIVERRAPEVTPYGVLDLNVFLAKGLAPKASVAAELRPLQLILARADQILRAQGVRLGDIDWYDLSDSRWDVIEEIDFFPMLRQSAPARVERVNLFLVAGINPAGMLGVSGAISGPKRNGTSLSGVTCIYDPARTDRTGGVVAHEIGHYLGLWHLLELDGSADIIDDTPFTATDNLMWRSSSGGATLTAGQGLVIRGHPHVRTDKDVWSPPLLMLPQECKSSLEGGGAPCGLVRDLRIAVGDTHLPSPAR